jgi:hypothetical protein
MRLWFLSARYLNLAHKNVNVETVELKKNLKNRDPKMNKTNYQI